MNRKIKLKMKNNRKKDIILKLMHILNCLFIQKSNDRYKKLN